MDHEHVPVEYAAFCDSARVALEHEARLLRDNDLDQVSAFEGTWHPNGFAVFYLNEEHPLGKLRLHIWPDTTRLVRPDGAPIHTHVWHLCSRILTGTYSETLFETTDAKPDKAREFHSAHIKYLVDKDNLSASDKAFLKPAVTLHRSKGEFHSVPADVPHETHISESSFVATLLITSHPVSDLVTMYSPEKIQTSTYNRPKITANEKRELLSRLKREVNKTTEVIDDLYH